MSIELGDQSVWQNNNLESLRYDYLLNPNDLVLDIGSYRREFGQQFELMGCKVEYFDALDNRAAWTHDGEIEMGGQYYYTSMFDTGQLGPVQKFKCVDIVPFLKNEVALVKINIEGGEYELLPYIMPLMKNIKFLQVQFHHISGLNTDKLYEEIARDLSKTHEIEWSYPFVWESWKRKI